MTTDEFDNDDDLNVKIRAFQSIQPTEDQILRWYLAIDRRKQRRKTVWTASAGVASGIFVGVLFGWTLSQQQRSSVQNYSATYQTVSIKYSSGGIER